LFSGEFAATFVHAGAALGGYFPRIGAGQITVPERPRPTLQWSHRIDRASPSFLANSRSRRCFDLGEEDAVEVAVGHAMFVEADTAADPAAVFVEDLLSAELEKLGEAADFFVGDPDEPGSAGAAVAALGAGEAEAVGVPGAGGAGWVGLGNHVQLHRRDHTDDLPQSRRGEGNLREIKVAKPWDELMDGVVGFARNWGTVTGPIRSPM